MKDEEWNESAPLARWMLLELMQIFDDHHRVNIHLVDWHITIEAQDIENKRGQSTQEQKELNQNQPDDHHER